MDGNRFDEVTRSLRGTSPRRGAVALLMGGALGLAGLAESEAKGKKKGKKKKGKGKKDPQADACEALDKSCGQGGCQFSAACCYNHNCDVCAKLNCVGTPPGTPGTCGCLPGETMLNGVCGTKPECLPAGSLRMTMFDTRCCSGIESPVEGDALGKCEPGYLSCLDNGDCVGGSCRGYECAAPQIGCQP